MCLVLIRVRWASCVRNLCKECIDLVDDKNNDLHRLKIERLKKTSARS